jgi:GNAT superfamily N-acetyltransferase
MVERFEMDAADRDGARRYLLERAWQALRDGFHPATADVEPLVDEAGYEWGARALAHSREGVRHQTVYVYAPARGQGRLSRYLRTTTLPVVTTPDCAIEQWLAARGVPFVVVGHATEWKEYRAVSAFYGSRRAVRSGVPYMHHIDEGLAVLERIGATERAARAFCLHPLVQRDEDLAASWAGLDAATDDPRVLALALEYRAVANATLSHRAIGSVDEIALSPLAEVTQMLVADKVQNRKDFLLHHHGTHPRSEALARYFTLWLERLGISEARFAELFVDLQVRVDPVPLEAVLR